MELEPIVGRRRRLARRLARAARQCLIRTDRGRLRPLWIAASELFIRVLGAYLTRGLPAAVYVRGTFARGEPVFGLSDIDLVAVAAGAEQPRARLQQRWERLRRRVPLITHVVDTIDWCTEAELPALSRSAFNVSLGDIEPRSLFFTGDRGNWLHERPGLWPTRDWRLIAGSDLRPPSGTDGPDHRLPAVWRELQFWWLLLCKAVATPESPWVSFLCIKLVTEPIRILLWLEHGEQHFRRSTVLRRGLDVLPEEAPAIRCVLGLQHELHRPRPPSLDVVLPCFVRLSARIAAGLTAQLEPLGARSVALVGTRRVTGNWAAGEDPRPLCDWPGLAEPGPVEDSFVVKPARPDDRAALAEAIAGSRNRCYATLLSDGLIVRPSRTGPLLFRTVAFAGSDPVSAALIAGHHVARFPDAPGWSAADVAARAVAEHSAWLRSRAPLTGEEPFAEPARRLAGLFSAARAALFADAIAAGDPALPMTFAATAELLADRLPSASTAITDAYASYRARVDTRRPLPTESFAALTAAFGELGWY
jgi:hypothetical protein